MASNTEKDIIKNQAKKSEEDLKLALIVGEALSELRIEILIGLLTELENCVSGKINNSKWRVVKKFQKKLAHAETLECSRADFSGSLVVSFENRNCSNLYIGVKKNNEKDPVDEKLARNLDLEIQPRGPRDNDWHWWIPGENLRVGARPTPTRRPFMSKISSLTKQA